MKGSLLVPAENLLDASLDGMGKHLVSQRIIGWTAMTTYGTDESLYRRARLLAGPEAAYEHSRQAGLA